MSEQDYNPEEDTLEMDPDERDRYLEEVEGARGAQPRADVEVILGEDE